jgi:hypothetical protein
LCNSASALARRVVKVPIAILPKIDRETPGMLPEYPAVAMIISRSSIDHTQFAASETADDAHDLACSVQLIHWYVFGYAGLLFRAGI